MSHQRGRESRTARVCFQSLRRVAVIAKLKSDDHRMRRTRSDVHLLYSSWTGPGPSTGIHRCTGMRMKGVIPPMPDMHGHAQRHISVLIIPWSLVRIEPGPLPIAGECGIARKHHEFQGSRQYPLGNGTPSPLQKRCKTSQSTGVEGCL